LLIALPLALSAQKKNDGLLKSDRSNASSQKLNTILSGITPDGIFNHVQTLASDSFEGRKPGTQGETSTINYLVNQFKSKGIKPADPQTGFLQEVSMVNFKPLKATLLLKDKNQKTEIIFPEDLAVESFQGHLDGSVRNSHVVFAGYGIVAPEYGWDDYKNLDVKGKIVIVLSGEPLTKSADKTDGGLSNGTLDYYGLRVYKYSVAEKKGAAALFIAHRPESSISFRDFQGAVLEQVDVKPGNNISLNAQGVLSWKAFNDLCKAAHISTDSIVKSSLDKNFYPARLNITGTIEVESQQSEIRSYNVVGKVEGSDKNLKSEFLVYTAHWDHYGKDTTLKGDQIYNGAFDNALGVASLLEIAAGFARLKVKPKRSILFIATTAEETRWSGALYYTTHPLFPLSETIANINLDGCTNPWGKTKEIGAGGANLSTLEREIEYAARLQGRLYVRRPEYTNFLYRTDAFEFVKVGIPSVTISSLGSDVVGKSQGNGVKSFQEYFTQDYHKVTDEIKPGWDLSGAAMDAQFALLLGYQILNANRKPEWKQGTVYSWIRRIALKE
jgi:Zn-dependent M28 family amino/carboxypeptidase